VNGKDEGGLSSLAEGRKRVCLAEGGEYRFCTQSDVQRGVRESGS